LTLANGQALNSLRVTVPMSGRMVIEASASEPPALVAGLLTFVLGDLVALAAPMPGRIGTFAGNWSCSAIGGRGGWSKSLDPKGYQSPIGVMNTQVFTDAALSVGEAPPVVQFPDMLPQFFVRRRGPASRVFRALTGGQIWWVDGSGVTQVGFRTPSVAVAPFDLINRDMGRGRLVIATDNPAAFSPGVTLIDPMSGPATINAAVWTSTGESLRGEIWIA
jgi:hypothetical protein